MKRLSRSQRRCRQREQQRQQPNAMDHVTRDHRHEQPESVVQRVEPIHQVPQSTDVVPGPSATPMEVTDSIPTHDDHYCIDSFKQKYTMTRILRVSGNSTVWSGYDNNCRVVVAIKVVKCVQKRIVPMEVRLMEAVANVPGVIRLLDWYLSEGSLYIVMEKPDGAIDLCDYLQEQHFLLEDQARGWFSQVVECVIGCFKAGVVHCDLIDQNLLVDSNSNQVKLIDFGSGAFVRDLAQRRFITTDTYSPPEMIAFRRYEAIPATVWSLGILLFKMVCGQEPFENNNQILEVKYEFTRMLSPECRNLIGKCFTRDPNERITLEGILQEDWFNVNEASTCE